MHISTPMHMHICLYTSTDAYAHIHMFICKASCIYIWHGWCGPRPTLQIWLIRSATPILVSTKMWQQYRGYVLRKN